MDNKYKILIPLVIAGAMGTVDSSVVNVAMPTLAKVFEVEMQTISWVSTSYLLVLTGLLLTSGRLGDIYGYKKPFECGLLIFTVGTILCCLAPNLSFLICARVFQAVGTSLIMAAIPAMIVSYFPPEERGKAMSLNVVAVSIGLTLGPSLGGFILSKFIWRYIFIINIPLGVLAFLSSKIFIPTNFDIKRRNFDYVGTALALVFLISLLFYINQAPTIGWLSRPGLVLIITSILSFVVFIYQEKKSPEPMLDLSLFSNLAFNTGLICNFTYFLSQVVMVFLTPFLLTAAKYPTEVIGLVVTAFPLAMMFSAPISGFLSDWGNPNFISALGGMLAGLSMLLMGTLPHSFSYKDVALRMIIFGIGGGLFETSNAVIILSNAPEHRRGIASGVLAMVRNAGMVFGIAISSALASLRIEYHSKTMLPLENHTRNLEAIKGIKDVFILGAVSAVVCTIIALIGAFYAGKKKSLSKS